MRAAQEKLYFNVPVQTITMPPHPRRHGAFRRDKLVKTNSKQECISEATGDFRLALYKGKVFNIRA